MSRRGEDWERKECPGVHVRILKAEPTQRGSSTTVSSGREWDEGVKEETAEASIWACLDTGGREDCTPRCPLSIKIWGALKGKVGDVVQGQRQFYLTSIDSTAIGSKHLANFHHWDTGWYMEFIWGAKLGLVAWFYLTNFSFHPPK